MDIQTLVDMVALAFEVTGVGVLALGAVWSALRALVNYIRSRDARNAGGEKVFARLRTDLGRTILLGLEILVAADIIRTVGIEPTLEGVLVLGLIVLIRTFLSFSLEVEIEGKLPWRRERHRHRDEWT